MSARRRAGFALVDVVIALALAGLAVLLAHEGFAALMDRVGRAEATRGGAASAVAIRRQLVSWIRAAAVSGRADYWDFFAAPAAPGYADAVLSIVTDAPGPFGAGRLRLTLAIDRDPATPERGLVAFDGAPEAARVDTTAIDTTAARPRALQEVVPGAAGLHVRYLHTVAGERFWTSSWASSADVPEAVEVQLFGDSLPQLLRQPIFVVPRGIR